MITATASNSRSPRLLFSLLVLALAALAVLGSARPVLAADPPAADLPVMKVYKTPTCGCCGKWVDHMKAAGFTVEVTDMEDVGPIKQKNGIRPELSSCHTALVGGYVVEGHVPAADVRRLLREKPAVVGIAVPQMPAGSPGMEGPVSQPYDTLAIQKDGTTTIFASHR